MRHNYRVCAKIHLNKIKENLIEMSNHVGDQKKVMAVVKADGYGHGAVQVATYVEELPFLWGFGVATMDEAVELRMGGVKKPIIVFGCVFPDEIGDLITYDIIATIYTLETANILNQVAIESNTTIKAHIKVDTGMARLGFLPNDESVAQVAKIVAMPNLNIEGMFTHYAKADEKDLEFTYQQHNRCGEFFNMVNDYQEISYFHCSNSGGIISYPQSDCNIVRAGISMYGYYPSDDVPMDKVILQPALTLTSHVSFVKEVAAGTPVSYGGTYITTKTTKIATIPVGYGDGYPRSLSNLGEVLIGGKRCKILGRVCMDQFMVDVTHLDDVKMMDGVVLVGKMGDEEITVGELADLSSRFNYEFLCCLGKRIPREYL
jgi:alanine racemase